LCEEEMLSDSESENETSPWKASYGKFSTTALLDTLESLETRQGGYRYAKITTRIRSVAALFFIGYMIHMFITAFGDFVFFSDKFSSTLSFLKTIDQPSLHDRSDSNISDRIDIIKKKFSKFRIIHIGKCGGSTLRVEFKKHKIKYKEIHVRKFEWKNSTKSPYIITIRNPLSRFVSAYNWRYYLNFDEEDYKENQSHRFHGEKKFLKKYNTSNALAEALYDDNGVQQIDFVRPSNYVHHLKEDIHFYLKDLKEDYKNIYGVVATETMAADMKRLFGIELAEHSKDNGSRKKYSKFLSEKAKRNLLRYYQKDFEDINKLHRMNLLTSEQYEKLTKVM